MPGYNRQGPAGQGPMTGRGLGPCGGGYARRGYYPGIRMGAGFGRGMGAGFGMRAGIGNFGGYYPPTELSKEEQKAMINDRKAYLENEIADLQKNLEEL